MGLFRGVAAAGIAKKAYDWARRPENQAKMRQSVERLKQRGSRRGQGPTHNTR